MDAAAAFVNAQQDTGVQLSPELAQRRNDGGRQICGRYVLCADLHNARACSSGCRENRSEVEIMSKNLVALGFGPREQI